MTNLTSALNFGALITLSCCNAVLQVAAVPSCGDWAGWTAVSPTQLPATMQPGLQGRPRATAIERPRCDRSKQQGANRRMRAGGAARSVI